MRMSTRCLALSNSSLAGLASEGAACAVITDAASPRTWPILTLGLCILAGWLDCPASWLDVYAKLVEYKRVHGHLLIPFKDKELGLIVSHIRSHGEYTNGIKWREDKLDEIGFVWDVGLHLWQEFLLCESVYSDFNAPQKCKAYGSKAGCIRKQGDLIKGKIDRGRYLHNKGFKLHAKNAAANQQRWEEYFETGTLDFWYCNAMDIQ